MQIRRLRLTRFRHLDDIDFTFDDGVVLVRGASGSGKSTLLEAVLWTLYGAGVRGGATSLRSATSDAQRATTATLDFEHLGAAWRVTRTLDGDVSLHHDDALSASGEDADAALRAVLGDLDDFLYGAVTGRRELQHLVTLHPAERLRTLARWLGGGDEPPSSLHHAMRTLEREIAESDERIVTLRGGTALLAQYAPELERARAELEVADREADRLHDEWAQKRQDVETRLAAYHRRAEELARQIQHLSHAGASGTCPTCEQPLGAGAEPLLARLDDEVYTAAQDSKWLMQRQAQLAQKPPDVVAAETRRARLRELVEDRAERVARCEQAMQELWTVANDRRRALAYLDALRDATPARAPTQPPDAARLDELAMHAGRIAAHVTGGDIDGVVMHADGRVHALRDGRTLPILAGADEELVALALRLAVIRMRPAPVPGRILLIDEPFGIMSEPRRTALLELLRDEAAQVLVCTSAPGPLSVSAS